MGASTITASGTALILASVYRTQPRRGVCWPQCTFEAATVAERGLRVRIAGVGLSASQRYLMRFGRWLPALPGMKPPPGMRMLSYSNVGIWIQAMLVPHCM